MSKLRELGKIIDRLLTRRRRAHELSRQLIFIVGNGIDDVNNILNDDALRRKAGRRYRRPAEFEAFKWRHFEYARYYTSNSLPSFTHCFIWKLVELGLCRDVITTNYDLFFDTIWQRFSTTPACQNPVLLSGEYDWEHYYSPKFRAHANPRYWKIHGSLSHVCFQSSDPSRQPHLHRLPRFAISHNNASLARSYRIPTQAPSLRFEVSRFPRTQFTGVSDLEASFNPFIDWTYANERSRFAKEIEGAKAALRSPNRIAALVIVGFSGYYDSSDLDNPWNEELVPDIQKLRDSGFPNIFMAVHNKQANRRGARPYKLMRDMANDNRLWAYDESCQFVHNLAGKCSDRFPYDYLAYEYERWRNLYEPKGEASHVATV